jgi:hypothetical protein
MIYTSTVISDEMEKPFVGESNHKWKIIVDSILICFLAYILSSAALSLSETVIGDKLGMLSERSLFAILSWMNFIMPLFIVCYMYADYRRLTFNDLYSNKMYMLLKFGQKSKNIVYFRLISIVVYTLSLYFLSFIFVMLSCLAFSYRMSLAAQFDLIIVGILFSLTAALTFLAISSFISDRKYALLLFLAFYLAFFFYGLFGGFYQIASSEASMMYIGKTFAFLPSFGFPYALVLFALLDIVWILIITKHKCNRYHTALPLKADLAVIDYVSDKIVEPKKQINLDVKRILRIINSAFCALVFLLALSSDFYLIYMGSKNLSGQYSEGTNISLLFDTDSLEPNLYKNDYSKFVVVSETEAIEEGDIVFYTKGSGSLSAVYACQVKDISGNDYHVVTTNENTADPLDETIVRSQIKGKLVYSSRTFGAWLAFNRSSIGKSILLGLPLFIVLFSSKLPEIYEAYKKSRDEGSSLLKKK